MFALAAVVSLLAAAPSTPADPWAGWAPLVGRWEAAPGESGETGWTTFERALDGKVLVRKNHAAYPARDGRPAVSHDDLLVVSREGERTVADYWDNEGHRIHYAVSLEAPGKLVFLSDVVPGAPRFKLTYAWTGEAPKQVAVGFEIAPPGSPETFKPYLSGTLVPAKNESARPK